ncbi:unnamed protein product, partial [Arabidopsis halleri]
ETSSRILANTRFTASRRRGRIGIFGGSVRFPPPISLRRVTISATNLPEAPFSNSPAAPMTDPQPSNPSHSDLSLKPPDLAKSKFSEHNPPQSGPVEATSRWQPEDGGSNIHPTATTRESHLRSLRIYTPLCRMSREKNQAGHWRPQTKATTTNPLSRQKGAATASNRERNHPTPLTEKKMHSPLLPICKSTTSSEDQAKLNSRSKREKRRETERVFFFLRG